MPVGKAIKAAPGARSGGSRPISALWTRAIPLEVFDARLFPFGWQQPGFDDSAWQNAALITTRSMAGPGRSQPPAEPYGPLHPRPIGKLGGERPAYRFRPRCSPSAAMIDEKIGDPVRRLEATFNLSPAGAVRSAGLPVVVDISGRQQRVDNLRHGPAGDGPGAV